MDHLKLTVDKLSVDEISDLVADDKCGAISLFVGTTRDNFEGKKVLRLEYEAYEPMAIKAMKAICDDIRNKWSNIHGIAIYHRLGNVPTREASVVIAVSSPHRAASLAAVALCIDRLKASVPIWKKEVYDTEESVWKENSECKETKPLPQPIDKNLVQINVSSEELQKRIQNFIERKRKQVDMSNIHDFIPSWRESETDDETCARVRTQFVKRNDSKGHLKVHKVYNEWGPQTVRHIPPGPGAEPDPLPSSIAERVHNIERFLNVGPVSKDIYKRIKLMEDKIDELQAISPEYSQFWKRTYDDDFDKDGPAEYAFSADDINKKIEQLEKMNSMT